MRESGSASTALGGITAHHPGGAKPGSDSWRQTGDAVLGSIRRDGVTVLTGLPGDPAILLALGHALGTPEPFDTIIESARATAGGSARPTASTAHDGS